MKYIIEIPENFEKTLKKIPKDDLLRIKDRIRELSDNPRPHGVEKLGGGDAYRIRQGNYRIVYEIYDKKLVVFLVKVDHRRQVYREK